MLNGTRSDEISAAVIEGVRALGSSVAYLPADLSDLDGHHALVGDAFEQFGRIDCLVNNAAVQVDVRGDMLEASPASFDRVMATNVRGAFFLTQAFVKRMLARQDAGTHRSVIQISSNNADIASPQFAEYCMSKAALSMFTKLLALRLAETGIAVYEVRPGITKSDMSRTSAAKYDPIIAAGNVVPMRRWGEPSGVGAAVAALACGAIPFSTGEVVHVDGGMHIPSFVTP